MIIDLMTIWKEKLLPKQTAMLPATPKSYSDGVPVSAMDLPAGVKIVFVKNKALTPVLTYGDLPTVKLTEDEQAIVNATAEQIKLPNFDGDHIFVSSVLLDTNKKTLYIEAQRGKYSLLMSMNRKKFPENSPILTQDLYGVGAIAPVITTDGKTVLLQSTKMNNPFTAVAGYVQPENADTKLVDTESGLSLIETTTKTELLEELLYDENLKPKAEITKLTLSSISFRKPQGGRGFVEFIFPAELNCRASTLKNIIKTNKAPDRKEFTDKFAFFPLYADERGDIYKNWSEQNPAGCDLHPSALRAAAQNVNSFVHGKTAQTFMPNSRIEYIPASFFKPVIPKLRLTEKPVQSVESSLTNSTR